MLKVIWKGKGIQIAKTILKKRNKVGTITLSDVSTLCGYSLNGTVILVEKETHRSTEQDGTQK